MIDVSAWPRLRLVHRIEEGSRNEVWRAELDGKPVAVRQSRRAPASLQWELDLLSKLDAQGFLVPTPIAAADGQMSANGVAVQRWIDGVTPKSTADWQLVATELQRLHRAFADYPQRPGSCTVNELASQRTCVDADLDAMPPTERAQVLDVLAKYRDVPVSLIHGDPDDSNLRIIDGTVGLLDWDESRVDVTWHDLSNLGVVVLDAASHERAERLSNAWEAANGWVVEPEYARRRLESL